MCRDAARKGFGVEQNGNIGGVGIFKSCNAESACDNTDYYCNGDNSTVAQDIDEGFETCCNEAFSCNGTSFQSELPKECTPKEKKNKPWGN